MADAVAAAIGLTRARLYVQVAALESDLQGLLVKFVAPALTEQMLLDVHYDKCVHRRNSQPDTSGSDAPLTDFLDFADYIHLLNQHRSFLPTDDQLGLRNANDALNRAVPIRNRVMHASRPLHPTDPEELEVIVNTVTSSLLTAPRLRRVASEVRQPGWQPLGDVSWESEGRVLHNLPTPDFDETGLIGRGALVARVSRLLTSNREPVITLVGPGGVGKTALALQVLSDLTIAENPPYDAILWASLKTESLTGEGIQRLRGATADVFDLPSLLVEPIEKGAQPTISELAGVMEGTRTLVAIDNLETVDADQVLELYDGLPADTRFLFTSRRGLGQLERRVVIGELDENDAAHLLRLFARRRGVERLAQLPNDEVANMARTLRLVPLAIKWFVMAVARGARPEDVLHDQTDLLRFCLDSVIESLSEPALEVAHALHALSGPCSFTRLGVVLGMPADDLRSALLELQQSAVVKAEGGTTGEGFVVTEAVDDYLKTVAPPRVESLERVRSEADRLRRAEERRRVDEERRSLGPNAVRIRHDGDAGAADLLRQALSASKGGRMDQARELLDSAEALTPAYFEVHRVRAFIAAYNNDYSTATSSYRRALELCETTDQRAFVLHYFGEHLLRNVRDLDEGTEALEQSHDELQQPESAMSLARAYTFQGRYDEARQLLQEAIKETSGRARLIAETSLLDSIYRSSEECLERDRNPVEAIRRALDGVRIGRAILGTGVADRRLLTAAMKCFGVVARGLVECQRSGIAHDVVAEATAAVTDMLEEHGLQLQADNEWWRIQTSLHALHKLGGPNLHAPAEEYPEPEGSATGILKRFLPEKGFGFITPDAGGEDVFFHKTGLHPTVEPGDLLEGLPVAYEPETDDQGRARGRGVQPLHSARPRPPSAISKARKVIASGSAGHIIVYFPDRGYGFISRDDQEPDIYYHVTGLRDPESVDRLLVPDTRVRFDIVDVPPKGFRAVDIHAVES
jgi:cold shock CspA family protein/tetratricopeptide (TPR) repeat protein